MEGNIVKMKKKVVIGITCLVVIGLGILLGSYLYYNLSEDQLAYFMMNAVQ